MHALNLVNNTQMSLSTLSSSSIHLHDELSKRPLITFRNSLVAGDLLTSPAASLVLYGHADNFCHKFRGLKLWLLKNLNIRSCKNKFGHDNKFKKSKVLDSNLLADSLRIISSREDEVQDESDSVDEPRNSLLPEESCTSNSSPQVTPSDRSSNVMKTLSSGFVVKEAEVPSLSIAVIGATGDLSRKKIFPALFALYYSGFLPENVRIFGYSREKLTEGDLRSLIASTLTCRVDHRCIHHPATCSSICWENCGSKMDSFLSKTCYVYGGYDNQEGILKLNARMEQIEGELGSNRIFYLSVPQEAVLDVASCIADKCQTKRGWNRIIIEKPFGFNALSSNMLTESLLSKFKEKQLYRMDYLLGRNLIENLTVLRFSNLVFEPLWSRKYVRNVQVIISEELDLQSPSRYSDNYGVIQDMVHSHVLQTIALLAMETPISLDGEDIRNEKVKVLKSIGKLQPSDVILGQYKARSKDKIDVLVTSMTPTFFAAALYINNARWDGVPFLIRAGTGLLTHRMEIRIQFDYVPGNIYRGRMGHNIDLATNELILRDVPDEAILIRVNNKVPGLSLHLDASELNLLYKDKYNVEVPDSYEHLILDVIDGDNHLFMRSDELSAAWDILTPVLQEIDKNSVSPELYDLGGRGPVGAYYLWAKHGVRWVED